MGNINQKKTIDVICNDVWNLLPYPWRVNENGTVDLRVIGDIGTGQTGPICDVFGGKEQLVYQYAKAISHVPAMIRLVREFCDSLGDRDTIPTQRQANLKARALRIMEDIGVDEQYN